VHVAALLQFPFHSLHCLGKAWVVSGEKTNVVQKQHACIKRISLEYRDKRLLP